MTTLQKTIIDCLTGETVTRDFDDAELAQFKSDQAQAKKDVAAKIKADELAADQRQQILDRLGITNDEIKILLG
jgi:hypothetical protein